MVAARGYIGHISRRRQVETRYREPAQDFPDHILAANDVEQYRDTHPENAQHDAHAVDVGLAEVGDE